MLAQGELDRTQLLALIEASKLLNSTLDRDEVLQDLMTLAAQGLDADRAVLHLLGDVHACGGLPGSAGLCRDR